MIIEEALQRAKLQRQALQRTASQSQSRAMPRPQATPPHAPDMKLERYSYDINACEANRILVPENVGTDTGTSLAAYRMLRTRILHRVRSNGWTTLAVTSPGPGEGKSVTALNLALSAAREKNNNVFLLDLDMSNPSMCPYLGIEPRHGITEFFADEAAPEQVLFSIGVDHLALAGGVDTSEFSSELLATGRLEVMLDYIRSAAPQPLIILDLPPVLSTDDFLVVATRIDATLLVLSEGRTRRDGVERTMDVLSGFTLAGVMLNRSHERVTDYYSRRYGYGYPAKSSHAQPPAGTQ